MAAMQDDEDTMMDSDYPTNQEEEETDTSGGEGSQRESEDESIRY
jgi:hypothetical protein